jgi:glutathione peroxidase
MVASLLKKWILLLILISGGSLMMAQSVYDFPVTTMEGKDVTLADYRGKVLLIVNTASKCGFTPQFKGLQELYASHQEKGLVVLGFPCNQFLSQDPGTNEEILSFCSLNYGVTFPMFAKIEVNGSGTHPLFAHLKKQAPGMMGMEAIKWNFTKFLVDREGKVIGRFSPQTEPASILSEIEKLL